jgi:hypothetical protein
MARELDDVVAHAVSVMRRLRGAMRKRDDLVELMLGPGLDDLQSLVGDVRAAGLDVLQGKPIAL